MGEWIRVVPRVLIVAALAVLCACATTGSAGPLAKRDARVVRVMTWNVAKDSIFPDAPAEASRHAQFARLIAAIQPDVVCLQEVFRGSEAAAALLDSLAPLRDGRRWQHHGVLDNVILSRGAMSHRDQATLDVGEGRQRGHAMALVDGGATTLYLICAHFHSRGIESVPARERQADLVGTHIRAQQAPGGLPPRTPIVVLGDLNAVASLPPEFVTHLRTGTIAGVAPPGGRGPDWDGSTLEDVEPRHNGRGEDTWTWRWDAMGFPPGALDRVLYTGSVLRVDRAFILDTTSMNAEELAAAGLERDDVLAAPEIYDHLPIGVDFAPR